ncbi:MAG TPA: hypothetical protein DDW52_10715 [Planctomycetaceae bacterium]|nr:hypothetical protein [Planctomycetaceae bacterium]
MVRTLTTGGVALAVSNLQAGQGVNGSRESRATGADGVELAIATICVDGFGNQHHEPAIEWIPKLGFENVELNLWYADQITPSYIASLNKRCRSANLQPISVQATGLGAQSGSNGVLKDVAHKLLMLQHAKSLGCEIVKFTGARRGSQGGLDAIIEVCKEIVPAAEEFGILVTLENHTGNNLETIEDYDRIFSAIDSPNIGLCLDTGHFEGSGIKLSDVLDRLAEKTLHVDLKDCRAFGKGHDTVPFGQGVTDFDAFLSQLAETGYHGYLVVEQAWREPKGDWKKDLAASQRRFQSWIDQR